jgi:hypothetical protein
MVAEGTEDLIVFQDMSQGHQRVSAQAETHELSRSKLIYCYFNTPLVCLSMLCVNSHVNRLRDILFSLLPWITSMYHGQEAQRYTRQ